ncbi:MAG: tetratricopeptide repeat protein, partial [Actinomycetia bacterium]|nr:tetratricopeptide repeat protein [Actinomycetes bacterium]
LILDNCEHILESTATVVHSLLGCCPHLAVLATSRQRLGIEGETTWTVPPLSFPGAGSSTIVPGEHEAVDLFVERARLIDTGFDLTEVNAPHVAAICRRLDGLPLAIELAAARVDMLSAAEIEHRLGENFSLLEKRTRFQPMRHSTLNAAVQWSYELLDDEERLLFERLSVFAGGFLIDDIEAVCVDEQVPSRDVFDVLARLVDKSLVVANTSAGPRPRYSMLEPLRAFAAQARTRNGECDGVAARHAERFLALAEEAEPELRGKDQRAWLDRLDADHDNLRLAFDQFLAEGRVEEALRTGAALRWFWKMHDNVAEGTARLESALAGSGDVSPAVRSRALTAAAVLKSATDVDAAYDLLLESTEVAKSAEDALCRGVALGWMGLLDRMRGQLDASERHLEEALRLVEDTGEGWAVSFVLGHLGVLARERGSLTEAIDRHERARAIATGVENPQDVAWNVAGIGVVHLYQGHFEAAVELLESSLEVEDDLGFDFESATALILLALAKARIGRVDDASALLGSAHRVAGRLGSARLFDAVYRARATVAKSRGDRERAAQLLGAAHRFRTDRGLPRSMFQAFFDLDEQDIRSALDATEFEAAWESGMATEMSDTTAL